MSEYRWTGEHSNSPNDPDNWELSYGEQSGGSGKTRLSRSIIRVCCVIVMTIGVLGIISTLAIIAIGAEMPFHLLLLTPLQVSILWMMLDTYIANMEKRKERR